MSSKIQPVRGTQDLLPPISQSFRHINTIALETAKRFGYEEISTPIFEFSEVFHRSLGETSDAVAKETYTFIDRGGDELTLRPEGTAGIARAFISNGLAQNLPLKFYYQGPMFRYERPQKGRYRQFHQLGVECLGLDSPFSDVECIALANSILENLNLAGLFQLEINSLGDKESRLKHRDLLVEYLQDFKSQLSADSQTRLQKNPLRILDSKDEGDKKILTNAPSLQTCLNQLSQDFFGKVTEGLQILNIPFVKNHRLVRGLDYYTHTVFEFTTTHLGAQNALIAGGRYDGLIAELGGPATAGVGWAGGMERLSLLLEGRIKSSPTKTIAVIPADEKSESFCFKLTHQLRCEGLSCEYISSGNMGKKMKRANKIAANFAAIIGETELDSSTVTLKNLVSGEQKTIPLSDLKNHLN